MRQKLSGRVGNTPVIRLKNYEARHGLNALLFAKAECFNPTGSSKDRAALFMIEDAERRGKLVRGGEIVEPTSGNTGISLAAFAAERGYKCVLVMPDSMSVERRKLLRVYGAELVLSPASEGMAGAVRRARELAAADGAFLPMQFENPMNAEAHYRTTGPELLRDMGEIDAFVAGVGTGGTLMGAGKFLKENCKRIELIAVEPAASPVLSGGKAGAHGIQGIGAGFVPALYSPALIDEVFPVSDENALSAMRELARTEGLFCGISSGAALYVATELAERAEYAGKRIAVLLPDSGDRYLSLLRDDF